MKLNISLAPPVGAIIQQKVASGTYHSVDDVIEDAVYLLDGFDRLRQFKQAALRQAIAESAAQTQSGTAGSVVAVLDCLRIQAERLARTPANTHA